MPGVPTGRGCDACRKQKKKCERSATAKCVRCHRFGLECVGLGQVRYKFQDEGTKLVRRNKPNNKPASSTIKSGVTTAIPKQTPEQSFSAAFIPRSPSNQLTSLTQSFISVLAPSIDISVQLVGNFGGFLFFVPSHLGTNPSLDAAADVVVTAHARYCAGHLYPDTQLVVKHSRALKALNMCLNDPVQASSSETLCAVMLLLICQVLHPTHPLLFSRPESTAKLVVGINKTIEAATDEPFESDSFPLSWDKQVVEALSDDRIHFTPQEWADLVVLHLDDGTADGDLMVCLGRLPALMQHGRAAIKLPPHSQPPEVRTLQRDISALHQTYQPVLARLRERWKGVEESVLRNDAYNAVQKRTLHCHYARILGLGLAVGIAINCALLTLSTGRSSLRDETKRLVDDILALEPVLRAYRPLGGLMMTLCLGAAWVGTAAPEMKTRIEALAMEYQRDIDGGEINAESMNRDLDCYRRQFSLEYVAWD
ncbi:MAG: hypothetical protein Q9195_003543 [Heterodermia aff. obscurata]